MRLDHIAYRTKDRVATSKFFIDAFGYEIQTEFDIEFDDKSTTKCIALIPPEKIVTNKYLNLPNQILDPWSEIEYQMAPEIFVSDGSEDSIVGKWVAARDGIGGIHHLAYEVDSVQKTMDKWKEKGWAEFASDTPLSCPGLVQVFTKPHPLTGVIYEFIERKGEFGFCKENVKNLMISIQEFSNED